MKTVAGAAPRLSSRARSTALQSEIMDLILERGLDVGDPVPTELELADALGVGRNTVRECLKVLQAIGVIDISHGTGMFVGPGSLAGMQESLTFHGRLSLRHGGHEASELIEVRAALEVGLLPLAMDAMSGEHVVALSLAADAMEAAALAGRSLVEHDAAFHRTLYGPLGNGLLAGLMDVFWRVHRELDKSLGSVQNGAGAVAEARVHREIFDAVVLGDKGLAGRRLKDHFVGIRSTLAALRDGAALWEGTEPATRRRAPAQPVRARFR